MRVVELPPKGGSAVVGKAGYRAVNRDCVHCKRPFRIYSRVVETLTAGEATIGVNCPYCHRSVAEVLVAYPFADVFVEPIE